MESLRDQLDNIAFSKRLESIYAETPSDGNAETSTGVSAPRECRCDTCECDVDDTGRVDGGTGSVDGDTGSVDDDWESNPLVAEIRRLIVVVEDANRARIEATRAREEIERVTAERDRARADANAYKDAFKSLCDIADM